MSFACVIPARYNSSRFPGKLLVKAAGKTVLQRTFEKAAECTEFDGLFVATDDERIAEHVSGFGGEVIWTSPECKNGTERICEAVAKHPKLQKAEWIMNVQGDHPCTHPFTLSQIAHLLKSDPEAVMATAATKIRSEAEYYSPHNVKVVFDTLGNALYFSRSPIPYRQPGSEINAYVHIGVYGYRRSLLMGKLTAGNTPLQKCEDLEQLKIMELGYRIKVAVTDEIPLGVDTPEDLVKLEQILCQSNTYS